MKCPFRIRTVKGDRFDTAKTTQEFEECCGEECAAALVVGYNIGGKWTNKVEGCKRLMKGENK